MAQAVFRTLSDGRMVYADRDYTDAELNSMYGAAPPPRPSGTRSNFGDDLQRGIGGAVSTAGSALRDIPATSEFGAGLEQWGNRVVENNPADYSSLSDIRSPGDFFAAAGEKVTEMAPQIAGTVGAGLLAAAAAPGVATAGALGAGAFGVGSTLTDQYGGSRQAQREQGVDDKGRALVSALPAAALEVIPGFGIGGRIVRRLGAPVAADVIERAGSSFLGRTARTAAEEAATEVGQTALQRYGGYQSLTDAEAFDQYGMAAFGGAAGGGLLGGVLGGRRTYEPAPAPLADPVGERSGPVDLLALPSPETISPRPTGPTLFADAEGITSENPAAIQVSRAAEPGADLYRRMTDLEAQPVGAQADWVAGGYQLPVDEAPVTDAVPADIGTGQPELTFPASSVVANDFDTTRITRILRGPGKTDGFVVKTAPKLAAALKANDVGAAQAVLADATESLQADTKLAPATVEARQAVLERAQLVVDTFKARMADAFNQEATAQREVAPTPATVVVDPAPMEPAVQGYAPPDIIDRNAVMAAEDPARRAEVLDRATNTTLKAPVENVFSRMLNAARLDPTVTHEELGQLVEAIGTRDAMAAEAATRDAAAAQVSTADIEARIPERAAPSPLDTTPRPTAITETTTPVAAPVAPTTPPLPAVPEVLEAPQPAAVATTAEPLAQEIAAPALPAAAAPSPALAARQQAMADMAAERAPQPAEVAPAVDTKATEKLIDAALTRKEIFPGQFSQLMQMLEGRVPVAEVETALNDAKALTAQAQQRYNTKKRWEPKPGDTIVQHNGKSLNLSAMDDLFQRLRAELTYKGFGDAALKLVLGDDVRAGKVPGLEPGPSGAIPSGDMNVIADRRSPDLGRRIIRVVADPALAGREMKTLNHEIVHLARDLGVWTPEEWSTLETWAGTQKNAILDVDKAYADANLTYEQTLEEVIAEAYADWEQSRAPVPPQVRTLFQKFKDFLSTVGRALKLLPPAQKAQLRTYLSFGPDVDTLFSNLSSGAIGDRARPRFNLSRVAVEQAEVAGAGRQRRVATDEVKQATKTIADEVRGAVGDKPARYASALMLGPSLTDFARRVGLRSVLAYDRLVRAAGRKTGVINERATELAAAYAALPTKLLGTGEGTLNSLAEASTRTGKWAFEPDWLSEEDLRGRTPEVDPDLAARLKAMGPKAEAVMREMFRLPHETFKQKKLVLDKTIQHTADDEIKAAEDAGDILEVARLKAQLSRARDHYRSLNDVDMSKPYASLQRSGDKVVVARSAELTAAEEAAKEGDKAAAVRVEELKANPAHYFFDAFDGNGEQARVARALDKRPEFAGNVDMFTKSDDEYLRAGGVEMMTAFRRLSTMLEDAGVDVDTRPLQRLLTDMYLRTLSSSSSRKAELRRLGVDSMPLDIMQNVLNQARSDAHAIGAMSTTGEKADALAAMKREARAKTPGQTTADKMAAYTEIMKREAASMEPPPRNDLVDNVLAATSSYMLTTSPAYFLQNALQNQTTVIPQLAAEHGYAKAQSALLNGYKEVKKAWSKTPLAKPLDFDALDPRMAELGHYLQDEGQLDVGINQDLGNIQALSANPVSQAATTVFSKLRAMVRLIEATGRYAAGAAAFNLALEKGSTADTLTDPAAYDAYVANRSEMRSSGHTLTPQEFAAAQHARKVISLAHGIYSPHAKPRFMNSPIGKVATQFRVFQILQLTLWADAIRKVFSSTTDPAEKLIAKRALAFMTAHTAVLAGGLGLPGIALFRALAEGVIDMFGGDDDEPADLERTLRETVKDPGLANLLLYGAPSLAGLDMSGSLGASTILSLAPYTDPVTDKQSLANYFTAVFGGPSVAGVGGNYADGLSLMARGDYYKALEKFMPKGVTNVMRATREATEGRTNRSGDVTRSAEDVDAIQTIYTALGLRTSERASEQWALGSEIERRRFQKDKTSRLKRDYAKAAKDGNSAEMAALRKEWMEFQANKPAAERQPLSELLKAPGAQRKRERQTVGGVQYNARSQQRAQELADLTGLAEEAPE